MALFWLVSQITISSAFKLLTELTNSFQQYNLLLSIGVPIIVLILSLFAHQVILLIAFFIHA